MKSQGGEGEDPDSRMDSERADRRDKKGGKGKVGIWKLSQTERFCFKFGTFINITIDSCKRSLLFALSDCCTAMRSSYLLSRVCAGRPAKAAFGNNETSGGSPDSKR